MFFFVFYNSGYLLASLPLICLCMPVTLCLHRVSRLSRNLNLRHKSILVYAHPHPTKYQKLFKLYFQFHTHLWVSSQWCDWYVAHQGAAPEEFDTPLHTHPPSLLLLRVEESSRLRLASFKEDCAGTNLITCIPGVTRSARGDTFIPHTG